MTAATMNRNLVPLFNTWLLTVVVALVVVGTGYCFQLEQQPTSVDTPYRNVPLQQQQQQSRHYFQTPEQPHQQQQELQTNYPSFILSENFNAQRFANRNPQWTKGIESNPTGQQSINHDPSKSPNDHSNRDDDGGGGSVIQQRPEFIGPHANTNDSNDNGKPVSAGRQPSKCEFWLSPSGGNLTTFGHYSRKDTRPRNCIYRISANDASVCSLELSFDDFDLNPSATNDTDHGPAQNSESIEKEFSQISTKPEFCPTDYLEFNERRRYCKNEWKNRMDVVDIDPNKGEKEFVFKFVSNTYSKSSKGFRIEYKPIPNSCKSKANAKQYDKLKQLQSYPVQMLAAASGSPDCEEKHTEMEFEIKSQNFPKNYSNNLDCVHYVMRASDEICGLEIRFLKFDLEESEGCAYDFLEVDGESFCGKLPDDSRNIFKFSNSLKTISFQTDSQVNAPGFHIRVRQVKNCANAFIPPDNALMGSHQRTQKCNLVFTEEHGTLTSPGYPDLYPDDVLCAYTIETIPGGDRCLVEIDFEQFDLQESIDCNSDFFEMENRRYCGKSLHKTRRIVPFSDEGFVKFLFKSDQMRAGKGFSLQYSQIRCDSNLAKTNNNPHNRSSQNGQIDPKQDSHLKANDDVTKNNQSLFYQEPCNNLYNTKRFILVSETVNGTYKENQACSYTIKKSSSKVCYLELSFSKFDLEASPDCQYDYVEIGNAVRLCGTLEHETSRIYVFDKPEMVVTFHSDASTERQGFLINGEQLECEGDRIVRENKDSESREEAKDHLQSLEQNKFEQHHHNDSQMILQEQENFLHPTSEFNVATTKSKFSQPDIFCSKIFKEKEFFIHSPGFPSNYQANMDCLYMIKPYSPSVCKLEINFDTFELQPYDFEKNCMKSDFVDIDSREQLCGKMVEAQSKIYSFSNQSFFIHFHSDSFKTSFDKGFRLYVRQIDCFQASNKNELTAPETVSHCNKIYTGAAFEIKSSLYPQTYPNNFYCQYRILKLISDSIKICYLEINFVDFDLQNSKDCDKDYVNFNGAKLCGSIAKDSVRLFPFYDNEFVITFLSDRLISGRGFHLKIRQNECPSSSLDISSVKRPQPPLSPLNTPLPPSNSLYSSFHILHANQLCQQTFNSIMFELQSPNYPSYYLPGLNCAYTIQRRHSRICQLELYFVDFDVEPSLRCLNDFFFVDGVKYCNSNRPSRVLQLPFYEQEKRILFQSVEFRRRKGYLIQARQVDCDTLSQSNKFFIDNQFKSNNGPNFGLFPASKFIFLPSLPSICEICVTEVTGNLQSYDYPNFYPPNVNCTYRITPLPDNCMVQVRFDEFDFDFSPECNQDYLEINGVRYCGGQLKGVSMILLNKRKEDLSIRMVTSSRGAIVKPSFRGFRASYTQLPCLNSKNSEEQPKPQKPSSMSTKNAPGSSKDVVTTNRTTPVVDVDDRTIYCDQTFDEKIFDIKSPGFPYRYFDNLNCAYLIRKNSANVCRLRLTFNYFNVVGEDGSCKGDYLDVFNTRICGVLERYTKKEIPFLQQKLLLHFHTNHAKTANGFHLVIDQVDCFSGDAQDQLPAAREDLYPTKTNSGSKFNPEISYPSSFVSQTKNTLRYDDDEIISDFDTKKPRKVLSKIDLSVSKPEFPVRTPTKINVEPHVVYDDQRSETDEQMTNRNLMTKGFNQQSKSYNQMPYDDQDNNDYPLRYFSRNITVTNSGGGQLLSPSRASSKPMVSHLEPSRIEQKTNAEETKSHRPEETQKPNNFYENKRKSHICDEVIMDKMYFELKSSDLKPDNNISICRINVKKSKSNICQLDIMFVHYKLNDATCSQQYLSVDGERICGHVHQSTIKKFWFMRPEMYLFVKLNPSLQMNNEEPFEIKARQVECATNIDQQQRPISGPHEMQMQGNTEQMKMTGPIRHEEQQPIRTDPEIYLRGPKGQRYNSNSNQVKKFSQIPMDKETGQDDSVSSFSRNDSPKKPFAGRTFENTKSVQQDISDDREEPKNEPKSDVKFNRYCDLIESDMQFKISSPRDRNIHRCRYTIRKANDQVCALDIKFNMFRLEDDLKCSKEYIEIDSGKICGAYSVGHERRYHFLPNEYEKTIYFVSNKPSRNPGDFLLEVNQIEDCSKPINQKRTKSVPTVCDITSKNQNGHIKSPNYPAPYADFTQCTFRIHAVSRNYCKVKLIVRDLDIEKGAIYATSCNKDMLEFQNTKLCGRDLSQTEYSLPFEQINGQQMVQLRFTSDASGTGRGFDIEYIQESCVEPKQTSGLISPGLKGMSKYNANHAQGLTNSKSPYSSSRIPMRPYYPPNYVSKAHLLKSMDRKEFIKLMMMEEEKDKIKMNITQSVMDLDSVGMTPSTTTITSLTDMATTTIAPIPVETTMTSIGEDTTTTTNIVTTAETTTTAE